MRRLIWGFAGRTHHIVGNLMHWLVSSCSKKGSCFDKFEETRSAPQIGVCNWKLFFLNQDKNVVGAQKNRLKETVLSSTQNMCLNK